MFAMKRMHTLILKPLEDTILHRENTHHSSMQAENKNEEKCVLYRFEGIPRNKELLCSNHHKKFNEF